MLNDAQKKAVAYTKGPLLIIAGAGTGKTTVVAHKFAHIVEKGLARPEHILALTFTEKAAAEMTERIDAMLDFGYVDIHISTFHAFCQKLLEKHALSIGISDHFSVVTEIEAWMLVRENLHSFDLDYYRPMGSPNRHIHALLQHFSKCKDELISPTKYLDFVKKQSSCNQALSTEEKVRYKEIANAYKVYNQLLLDNERLDFGDLVYYCVKILEEKPQILTELQGQFPYILVDEFQDVNWAQYRLVQLLAQQSQLTVVGDDDQSIYAFRGASVSNILRFKEDYPQAKEIVLQKNYRSGQEILDTAYTAIQKNNPDRLEQKLGIKKHLEAVNNHGSKVVHIHTQTAQEEMQKMAEKIIEIKRCNPDVPLHNVAILIRANSHAKPCIEVLERHGIPYVFLATAGLFRQRIVLDCMGFLRAIHSYRESSAIYRLLSLPCLALEPHDLQKLLFMCKKKAISYYFGLRRAKEFLLSDSGIKTAQKLLTLIADGVKKTQIEKPSILLYEFLEKSGYLAYLTKEESAGNGQVIKQIQQLQQFFDMIVRFEESAPEPTVASFLTYIDYRVQAGDSGIVQKMEESDNAVQILTIHASKGLEFDYVFMVNMVEDRFPSRRRGGGIELPLDLVNETLPEGDYHFQEERRLFYVAVTRAKKQLYFLSAENYGGVRKKKLSRFLTEIGFGDEEKDKAEKKSDIRQRGVTSLCNPRKKSVNHKKIDKNVLYPLPKTFSFSQIRNYQTCPYQYKLAHILKIPIRGNASFSFGNTIHNTLHKFYLRVQEMNSAKQASLFDVPPKTKKIQGIGAPTLADLLQLYENCWIDDWYLDAKQKEEYYKKGKDILQIFYAANKDNWQVPLFLESGFKIQVGPYIIKGKIDRIDQQEDGSIEIIDYKTGKSKEKLQTQDKEQLLLYQIAAESLPEYRNFGKVAKLTFFYVNDNIQTAFIGKNKDLEKMRDKITGTLDALHARNFDPKPSKEICSRCDFRDICEYGV